MIKRDSTGHAWRYTPDNPKTLTVWGKEALKVIRCRTCGEVKNQSSFYHLKQKTPMSECCECNDKRRLRNKKIETRMNKGIHVDKNLEPKPNLYDLELA